ncbi:MAG: biphenyl 2,3-dioxygenase [Planctomycetaceae bacterium]|nr:biphenyl 2,3-dioxygenase [Planctomycetaceae bacterium]MBP61764.1 biphenyl 2,3-dioxygenase [Planctomycetaceae bacterium]
MSGFVKVASTQDVPDGGKTYIEIEDRLVVLFQVDGDFYCLDDVCTHDGDLLGEGKLHGYELACPRHGAKFDIRTGRALTMPATEPTAVHEVKVEGDDLYVRIIDT